MLTKKRIIWLIAGIAIISLILLIIPGIVDYLDYQKAVEAAGGMPWQDGGKITIVREPCVLDTPATSPTTCAISCPLVTGALGPACTGYIEIDTVGQLGTTFIAAPIGFVYKGGGAHPVAGMQFIAGGATNISPWVIGIPGASASRIQKLVDSFKVIIAGFEDDGK
ncbi:hypothetical protein KKC04_00500 [Patescibacteria group bacterium]|nr:hypothetical protein [Patescibacteria group bacterium]